MKTVELLYGKEGMNLVVPDEAALLAGQEIPPLPQVERAVEEALACPIGAPSLGELVRARSPRTVAITISDITRPVPNKIFLPPMLRALKAAGVEPSQVVIIIGTGMHRPSTIQERESLVGREILQRVEIIDHTAHDPSTLTQVSADPAVSVNRRFMEADLRIVTGYIEPHFMAGFSGGRKGVCPALVDLKTIERFHSYATLAHPRADNGLLTGNPCHEIGLQIARLIGVDLLFNVALTPQREVAGIYCGDLEQAHLRGCEEVGQWTSALVDGPYDLVITNGGGFPLDQTFYQTVKGMVTALPALGQGSTLLQVSHCGEGLGSPAYEALMMRWGLCWQDFIAHLQAQEDETLLDQWELQMQCKVLARIGPQRLCFVSDNIEPSVQDCLAVNPVLGEGGARQRAQGFIDAFLAALPNARVAVIPEGPYTMLKLQGEEL